MITAGHCFGSSDRNTGYASAPQARVWGALANPTPVGHLLYSSVPSALGTNDPTSDPDVAVIGIDRGVSTIDAPPRGVARVVAGTRVCKNGQITRFSCGPVVSTNDDFIVAALTSFFGDSGAPLYNSDGALVGLLSTSTGGVLGPTQQVSFEGINRVLLSAFAATGFWPGDLGPAPADVSWVRQSARGTAVNDATGATGAEH